MSQWRTWGSDWANDSWAGDDWDWQAKLVSKGSSKGRGPSEEDDDDDWSGEQGVQRTTDVSWKRAQYVPHEEGHEVEPDWKRARKGEEWQANNGASRDSSGSKPALKPTPKKVPARAHIVAKREQSAAAPPQVTCRSCGNTGIDFMGKPCLCPYSETARQEAKARDSAPSESEPEVQENGGSHQAAVDDMTVLDDFLADHGHGERSADQAASGADQFEMDDEMDEMAREEAAWRREQEEMFSMAPQRKRAPPEPWKDEEETYGDGNEANPNEGSANVSPRVTGVTTVVKPRWANAGAAGGVAASGGPKGKGFSMSKARPPDKPGSLWKPSSASAPRFPRNEYPEVACLPLPLLRLQEACDTLDADLAAMAAEAAEEAPSHVAAPRRVQPCWSYLMTGFCEAGDACPSLHGTGEDSNSTKVKPPITPSKVVQPCWEFAMTGFCAAGATCPCIHGTGSNVDEDDMFREEDLIAAGILDGPLDDPASSSTRTSRPGRKSKWDADDAVAPQEVPGGLGGSAMTPLALSAAIQEDAWVKLSPQDAETIAASKEMFNYKTTLCKHASTGNCPHHARCRYAHSLGEIHKPGQMSKQVQKFQAAPEVCLPPGAGAGAERIPPPTDTPDATEVCWTYFQDGVCKDGDACPMSHSIDDLHAAMTGGAAPGLEGLQAAMAAGEVGEAVAEQNGSLEVEWPELAPHAPPGPKVVAPPPGAPGAPGGPGVRLLPGTGSVVRPPGSVVPPRVVPPLVDAGPPAAAADNGISWVPVPPDQLELLAGSKEVVAPPPGAPGAPGGPGVRLLPGTGSVVRPPGSVVPPRVGFQLQECDLQAFYPDGKVRLGEPLPLRPWRRGAQDARGDAANSPADAGSTRQLGVPAHRGT